MCYCPSSSAACSELWSDTALCPSLSLPMTPFSLRRASIAASLPANTKEMRSTAASVDPSPLAPPTADHEWNKSNANTLIASDILYSSLGAWHRPKSTLAASPSALPEPYAGTAASPLPAMGLPLEACAMPVESKSWSGRSTCIPWRARTAGGGPLLSHSQSASAAASPDSPPPAPEPPIAMTAARPPPAGVPSDDAPLEPPRLVPALP